MKTATRQPQQKSKRVRKKIIKSHKIRIRDACYVIAWFVALLVIIYFLSTPA